MRKAENLPPYRAVVMKSGRLNFLEPSGPAQACYGRAIPLPSSIVENELLHQIKFLILGGIFRSVLRLLHKFPVRYGIKIAFRLNRNLSFHEEL